jgi:hypothetical protein
VKALETTSNQQRLDALLAVLEAARANLVPCSSGGYFGRPWCGKPVMYTLGSPNVAVCKVHAREHEGRRDLWEHPQIPLVAAIAAYDALADALPSPSEGAA